MDIKKIINEKSQELKKINWKIGDEVFEDKDKYVFFACEDIEEPMDGVAYIVDKKSGKIIETDSLSIDIQKMDLVVDL